jgi:hypothetical protein
MAVGRSTTASITSARRRRTRAASRSGSMVAGVVARALTSTRATDAGVTARRGALASIAAARNQCETNNQRD